MKSTIISRKSKDEAETILKIAHRKSDTGITGFQQKNNYFRPLKNSLECLKSVPSLREVTEIATTLAIKKMQY